MKRLRWFAVAAMLLAALGGAFLYVRSTWSAPPNVVLVCIDALRRDAVSPYSPSIRYTPTIQALAAQGLVGGQMIAQSSYTPPSIASVMTGKLPGEIGAGRAGRLSIANREITLAELLKQQGYVTGAVVCNPLLTARAGFAQGFDSYNDAPSRAKEWCWNTSGQRVTACARRWLARISRERSKPFFLYLHYADPHANYSPPSHLCSMIGSPPPDADDLVRHGCANTLSVQINRGERVLSQADVAYLRRCYDAEVAYTDQCLGEVFAYLKGAGLWSNTAVVLFADHGEEFMEHGGLHHEWTLYREVLAVPLIVKLPASARRPAALPGLSRNYDLLPTIAALTGIGRRPEWRGIDLLSGKSPAFAPAELGAWGHRENGQIRFWRAVYTSHGALIWNPRRSRLELYRASDAAQRHDAATAAPALVRELSRYMPPIGSRTRASLPLSASDRSLLRSLGYTH